MTTKKHVPLSEKTMLVSLNVTQWSVRRHDAKITDEVAQRHKVENMGRYNKRLVPKERVADVKHMVTLARDFHATNTLPWCDEGLRIMKASNYMAYTQRMREIIQGFDKAADELARDYNTMMAEAKRSLNSLFDAKDYPKTGAALRRKYSMVYRITPLPDAADFRVVDIDDKEMARIRKSIEANLQETFAEATRDVWRRIHESVSHIKERLDVFTVDKAGKVEHPFRDSMITNLRDLVTLLPHLNIEDDPNLERMRQRLDKELASVEPDTLREDEKARDKAMKAADAMLATMAGYVGDLTMES
jgi:hypothetical protein